MIKFTIPAARRPNEFKKTRDRRVLGFCLETVTVIGYSNQRVNRPVVLSELPPEPGSP